MNALFAAGFVGCGNMGGALATAATRAEGTPPIAVYDPSGDKLRPLVALGATQAASAAALARQSKLVFLGVKPTVLGHVLEELCEGLKENPDAVLVSMAAAVSIADVRAMLARLGLTRPVIRIMPNTPSAVGCGMTVYAASEDVSAEDEARFLSVMRPSGEVRRLDESRIDAAGCVSGCGPAFAYMFAEALADGGVACGLTREDAAALAAGMLSGAAEMLKVYGHPADLKDAVCSPGGTTICGVKALEGGGFRASVMAAVQAAYDRTLEMKRK